MVVTSMIPYAHNVKYPIKYRNHHLNNICPQNFLLKFLYFLLYPQSDGPFQRQ